MSILTRLFRKKASSGRSDVGSDPAARILARSAVEAPGEPPSDAMPTGTDGWMSGIGRLYAAHLDRMMQDGALSSALANRLRNVEIVRFIAEQGPHKLGLSLADDRQHSVGRNVDDLYVHLSTISGGLKAFQDQYAGCGGYTHFLMTMVNGEIGQVVRAHGCVTLVHVQIHADKTSGQIGVHLTVFPLVVTGPQQEMILPTDLLTQEERRQFGL